jgi:acyl carrier protein
MQQRVKQVLSHVFSLPDSGIPDDAAFGRLEGWDSLGHITLMLAVEQEFGVTLTTEAMSQALTLPALVDFITQADKK